MFNSNIKSNQIKRQTIIVKQEPISGQSLQLITMCDEDDNEDSNCSNDNANNDHHCVDEEEEEEVLEDCDEEDDESKFITIETEDNDNDNDIDGNTSESEVTPTHTITATPTYGTQHYDDSESAVVGASAQHTTHTSGTTIQYTTAHAPTHHTHATLALKSENGVNQSGAVTYRVVQVGHTSAHHTHAMDAHTLDGTHAVVTTTGHALVAPQTIIATPFGGTPTPTGGGADAGVGGPFYVMMTTPTQEIIHTTAANTSGATLAHSRGKKNSGHESTSGYGMGGQRAARDEKRRATHNEVERRRRDKINNWIMKLSKVVPDCQQDHTKQGQSKGGILAKATEYIQELCQENSRLNEVLKENEVLSNELDAIRQQFVDTKNENRRLRALLQRNGISESESNDNLNTIS